MNVNAAPPSVYPITEELNGGAPCQPMYSAPSSSNRPSGYSAGTGLADVVVSGHWWGVLPRTPMLPGAGRMTAKPADATAATAAYCYLLAKRCLTG